MSDQSYKKIDKTHLIQFDSSYKQLQKSLFKAYLIVFHSPHKKVRDPQGEEQVSGSLFFFTSVLF